MTKAKAVNWLGEQKSNDAIGVPVPIGQMKLSDAKGSLELATRHGEPAVIVDGKYVIRRSALVRQLAEAVTDKASQL